MRVPYSVVNSPPTNSQCFLDFFGRLGRVAHIIIEMESTPQTIEFYFDAGMSPREIAGTLGVPLKRVYRTLSYSASGKRTLHFFPALDTSEQQLNRAEHTRDYVSRHLHPSKED